MISIFEVCVCDILAIDWLYRREEGTDRMEKTAVKKREVPAGRRLIDLVFSWSIEDVLNEDLYKN